MKPNLGITLASILLMLPLSALAASKSSSNIEIPDKVVVNGKQIQPGTYKVEWSGTGPNVEVSILQGHKTIAQVPARVVDKKYDQQAIVTHQNNSGTNVLDQIQLKDKELDLNAKTSSSASPNSNSGS